MQQQMYYLCSVATYFLEWTSFNLSLLDLAVFCVTPATLKIPD